MFENFKGSNNICFSFLENRLIIVQVFAVVFVTVKPSSFMILEKGFSTPKSKIVDVVVMCLFRNSNVCLNLLLGNVFSYIVFARNEVIFRSLSRLILLSGFRMQMYKDKFLILMFFIADTNEKSTVNFTNCGFLVI